MVILNWKNIKELSWIIASSKMDKTVVVTVKRIKMHPLYKKRFAVEKKYYVHNTLVANEWDTVKIRQTRPISKLKRRIVTEVVSTAI